MDLIDGASERGRVTLVATVHGSAPSRDRVHRTSRERRPDAVAVELDPFLFRLSRDRQRLSVMALRKEGLSLRGLLLYLLAGPRRWRPSTSDEAVTILAATEFGAGVVLVDRPITDTLNRPGAAGFSPAATASLIRRGRRPVDRRESIGRLDAFVDTLAELGAGSDADAFDLLTWFESLSVEETDRLVSAFTDAFPRYGRVTVRERDRHIAGRVQWLRTQGYEVVAVLGKGHVPGVARYLRDPESLPPALVRSAPFVDVTHARCSAPVSVRRSTLCALRPTAPTGGQTRPGKAKREAETAIPAGVVRIVVWPGRRFARHLPRRFETLLYAPSIGQSSRAGGCEIPAVTSLS